MYCKCDRLRGCLRQKLHYLCIMKKIAILVPETAVPAAIVDPRYVFTAVNEFYKGEGKQPPFTVQLVGMTPEVSLLEGVVTFRVDATLAEAGQADLVLIPALSGNLEQALERNQPFQSWIVQQYRGGAEVASLCLGAFLLASTGLMNGKACSTHWLFANQFRALFPEVHLAESRVVTDQNGLYSSGGATSYFNLLLYLVEKYTNRDKAILTAKFFLLDIAKNSQSPFTIFRGQKSHQDEEILQAQNYIEEQYAEKLTVEDLAEKYNMGRRTFERRFKNATHNSPLEYLQRVRIEAAKKYLETDRKTINEVMYEVGYSDVNAFRDVFRKMAGVTPMEYRGRYGKA
jgi:transcriptional regulator GlxA family with amidase domain